MGFVYVGILNDVNLAQVFLWLQEKSLFGFGALLHNAAPGQDFRASDLVRNLLMSPCMNWPLAEQEAHHQRYWISTIEAEHRTPQAVDHLLIEFLKNEIPPQRQHSRHVSQLEKNTVPMIGMYRKGSVKDRRYAGIMLYLEFYSYYEGRLLHMLCGESSVDSTRNTAEGDTSPPPATKVEEDNDDYVGEEKSGDQEDASDPLTQELLAGKCSEGKNAKHAPPPPPVMTPPPLPVIPDDVDVEAVELQLTTGMLEEIAAFIAKRSSPVATTI